MGEGNSPAPSAPDPTRPCPDCGAVLPADSRSCSGCGKDLVALLAAERAAAIEEESRADAAAGRFVHPPPGTFRRFRRTTLVCAILAGGSALLLVAAAWAGNGGPGGVSIFAWVLGCPALGCFLFLGIDDLVILPPDRLTTPERVFRTYLKCLRQKRWEYAWSLVAPRGRTGRRRRPAMDPIGVPAGEVALRSPLDLADFWKPLFHRTGGTGRYASARDVQVAMGAPDSAVAGCEVRVTASPVWLTVMMFAGLFVCLPCVGIAIILYLFLQKSETYALDLPMARIDGRWYLLDAVPDFPEGADARGLIRRPTLLDTRPGGSP